MTRFKQYLSSIATANSLKDVIEWVFYPGMLLDSKSKWWGDFKTRHAAHEGIDICFFRTCDKTIHRLAPGTVVPAWSTGTVVNLCEDFLGHTLVVEPDYTAGGPTRVLEVFSHLAPCDEMTPGTRVGAGRIIARTFDTRIKGSPLLSHLHVSCIEVASHIPFAALNWSLFPLREKVNVINPVFI
ncbi:MAG: hypothetical protein V2J08_01270 [Desulfotignum sp.]|jgi:hypothetical protein|nr:hypothetical protein [Desulfotignum sp.]